MSFIWPPFLLLLLAIPVGVRCTRAGAKARGAGGAVRLAAGRRGGEVAARWPATAGVAAPAPRRPHARRHHDPRPVARPTPERHRRAAARGHGPPRVRRLRQHGRHRRRADPHGGGQGRGARFVERPAGVGPDRDRRLQRFRLLDPGADRRPGRRRGRHPAARARARHVPRPGILQSLAVIDAAANPAATDYYTNAPPSRGRTHAGPGRHFEPAMIVLLTDGENTVEPDPLEAARPRGTAASGSTRSASAPRPARRSRSKASPSTPSSTRRPSRTSRPYRRHVLPGGGPGRPDAIYDDVGSRLVVRTEPFELTPLLAALGFALLLIGGLVSLRWFGRMP